ncbi:hypothetical protein [Glycomyces sp. YM15]|uniref:hypothetical protein n=1 Tax=Glycomyces sp. YM15 TaxID=2800446 RepID=UPI0019665E15|nr:hypothetical protein [Glycomyces sp. YM15]
MNAAPSVERDDPTRTRGRSAFARIAAAGRGLAPRALRGLASLPIDDRDESSPHMP